MFFMGPRKNYIHAERRIPLKFYCEEIEEVLTGTKSSKDGLTTAEAEKRLAENGKNKLAEAKKDSLIKRFFNQMTDPMISFF